MSNPARDIALCDIQHGMTVVDFGAGAGFHTFIAAQAVGSSGSVYAIEVQKELVSKLTGEAQRKHVPNVHVLWANFEKFGGTKLKDNMADRIICANTLFQAEDRDGAVLEMKRILKPKGKVGVIDMRHDGAFSAGANLTEMDARMLFEKHGFTIEKSFDYQGHQWGFLAVKS